jgi:hypothetical protein
MAALLMAKITELMTNLMRDTMANASRQFRRRIKVVLILTLTISKAKTFCLASFLAEKKKRRL